jgi:hypothetical protein
MSGGALRTAAVLTLRQAQGEEKGARHEMQALMLSLSKYEGRAAARPRMRLPT